MARFADLRAEALKGRKPTEPFILDDVDPPIQITAPTDFNRSVGLAELVGPNGEFETRNSRKIIELFCGDAYPRVEALIGGEHFSVMIALVNALVEHFAADLDKDRDQESVPGGE